MYLVRRLIYPKPGRFPHPDREGLRGNGTRGVVDEGHAVVGTAVAIGHGAGWGQRLAGAERAGQYSWNVSVGQFESLIRDVSGRPAPRPRVVSQAHGAALAS